jgi:hypothetical protein
MHPCKHVIRPVLWLPADDTVKGLQWDTMTSTDGKLLDEWANSGVLRDRVLPYPAATPEQRQLLVDRAKLLDLHHTAVAPTRMLDVVHGVVTGGRKASDRKLRHQGTAVERLVAGRGKQGGTQVTVKLQDGSQLLLQGGTELLARSEADVAAALMDQATQAFTPDVLRTFTSLCALMDRDGRVRADYVTLAELRGWDPATLDAGSAALKRQDGELVPRARTKRKRLQDAVQTLLDYQFSVTDGRNYVTGPLVVAYLRGGVLANGRAQERRVSVALNPGGCCCWRMARCVWAFGWSDGWPRHSSRTSWTRAGRRSSRWPRCWRVLGCRCGRTCCASTAPGRRGWRSSSTWHSCTTCQTVDQACGMSTTLPMTRPLTR